MSYGISVCRKAFCVSACERSPSCLPQDIPRLFTPSRPFCLPWPLQQGAQVLSLDCPASIPARERGDYYELSPHFQSILHSIRDYWQPPRRALSVPYHQSCGCLCQEGRPRPRAATNVKLFSTCTTQLLTSGHRFLLHPQASALVWSGLRSKK